MGSRPVAAWHCPHVPTGLVLLCDQLFRDAIGADCGGPAESAVAPDAGGPDWGPLHRPVRGRAGSLGVGLRAGGLTDGRRTLDMRTPAPQTPAFAVPETRTVEGDPGRALEIL